MNVLQLKRRSRSIAPHCIALALILVAGSVPWARLAAAPSRAGEMGANDLGRAIYTNCAACHGREGQGDFAPPLASDQNLKNTGYVISHILTGSANMPSFREQLSSGEIAAVVNYVRSHWGNHSGRISRADVLGIEKRFRGHLRKREDHDH